MTGWIREARGGRSMLVLLFAFVLAIRVAIPTGFMPTSSPHGIVVSVCTGMGETTLFLPIEREGDADRHGPAEGPCTFAASLGAGLLAPVPAGTALPVTIAQTAPASRAIADLTVHRLAAPPPPALGPPARA